MQMNTANIGSQSDVTPPQGPHRGEESRAGVLCIEVLIRIATTIDAHSACSIPLHMQRPGSMNKAEPCQCL